MKPNYLDIVRQVKAELIASGFDVDRDETSRAEITFRVADRLYRHWNPDVGLLFKDSGNQVRERAVDILCWRDGVIVDILGAGREGPNTPLWMENATPVDPGRWRVPFTYADTEPLPTPPPIVVPIDPPIVVPSPTVPVPPFPVPTPLPPPAPVPTAEPTSPPVSSNLATILTAAGAWAGQQLVAILINWWSKRKTTPPTTLGTAIPRPSIPTRTNLPRNKP